MNAAIRTGIEHALRRLGATSAEILAIDWQDNEAVTAAVQRRGGSFELLCTVGSRGDTLSDEDVLRYLRSVNGRGTIFKKVIADGD